MTTKNAEMQITCLIQFIYVSKLLAIPYLNFNQSPKDRDPSCKCAKTKEVRKNMV